MKQKSKVWKIQRNWRYHSESENQSKSTRDIQCQ